MPIQPGTYRYGPDTCTLAVRTDRTGAAAMAGHRLLIHVTAWSATLVVADDPAASTLTLDADGGSLVVIEGTGGVQALADDDKAEIAKTIDEDVLKRGPITFRSTAITAADDGGLVVSGDLTLVGTARSVTFAVPADAGEGLAATATLRQSDWKIKPYSTLFGALKVVDEVEVSVSTGSGAPGQSA
jgi:polyisoprenoid-binding protein YceI